MLYIILNNNLSGCNNQTLSSYPLSSVDRDFLLSRGNDFSLTVKKIYLLYLKNIEIVNIWNFQKKKMYLEIYQLIYFRYL